MLASPIKHGMIPCKCDVLKMNPPKKLSSKPEKEEKVFKFVQVALFYLDNIYASTLGYVRIHLFFMPLNDLPSKAQI